MIATFVFYLFATLVIASGRIASLAIVTTPERLAAARIVLLDAPVG